MARNRGTTFDLIPADAYPAIMRASDALEFLQRLKSTDMQARVANVIARRGAELRDVVRSAATRLEQATQAGAFDTVYAEAHEIRGLAGTCGLDAGGQIADRLCLYIDATERSGLATDGGIVGLHAGAIARAVHAEDEATRLGGAVAEELGALVARKLGTAAPQRFR